MEFKVVQSRIQIMFVQGTKSDSSLETQDKLESVFSSKSYLEGKTGFFSHNCNTVSYTQHPQPTLTIWWLYFHRIFLSLEFHNLANIYDSKVFSFVLFCFVLQQGISQNLCKMGLHPREPQPPSPPCLRSWH